MAETPEEMPLIDIQPEKLFSSWRATLKVCGVIALVCAVYGYLHVCIRTYLLKSKRLQQISLMVAESEEMLQNLYTLDQNLAADLEELNDFYLDYY